MKGFSLAVVVIGRNEGKRLVACLKSIHDANGLPANTEIIYVDSDSSDGSPETAAALGAKVIKLGATKLSAARARNAGWRASQAEMILFLDGDTILNKEFVNESLESFTDPSVAVVWGHRREIRTGDSLYNRVLDLDWIYAPGQTDFCGGDALMRRSCLEKTNGFNPDLIAGEEPDLCRRLRALGHIIVHIDVPMTGHDLAITQFHQYWRRAVRAGHAYAEIADRYTNSTDPFWTAESRANILRGSTYICVLVAALLLCITQASVLPFIGCFAGFSLLAIRTAFKSKWKGVSWETLLLFGFHSHFQQIPILQGQVVYFLKRWRNQDSALIEYKKGPK